MASDATVVGFSGNEYPGGLWPAIPKDIFSDSYEPTEKLRETLPFKDHPECVVHLRKPDAANDARRGLDDETLDALGRELGICYLITNNVAWYKRFEAIGWGNPHWTKVGHSAVGSKGDGVLQMWSDWYTIALAKRVVHTPSGFSESALRLSGSNITERYSRRLVGNRDGKLLVQLENWHQGFQEDQSEFYNFNPST